MVAVIVYRHWDISNGAPLLNDRFIASPLQRLKITLPEISFLTSRVGVIIRRKRPMIFTTNKPLNEWGKVLHDEDMAAAILDRVLERGRFIHLDGPSGRNRHLNLEETLPKIQNG
jgi:hypothetical protein